MSDSPEGSSSGSSERSGHSLGVWAGVIAFAMIILYPLSIGPLVYLNEKGLISDPVEEALEVVYLPVLWMTEQSESVDETVNRYVAWWEELAEEK